ncbi:MAG TPA: DNA primase [Anaeromyxobacteraceae bacterium]|nr:DNA primase [Anaeromyxobacteraceae bacterium]
MIPDAVIDEIRERVDIVAVIGRHVELKRSGRTWKGCCVFHGERTPSFHVYPEDKHFMCYGCGEHGDIFKFLQKLTGKEFPEIVRALALEVGVAIPEREEDSAEQRRRREERSELLRACDAAARYFAARLASPFGKEGRDYLVARGVSEEMVKLFRIGLASVAWDELTERLAHKGTSAGALERAGLVVCRGGERRYDRFRGRLIFPIAAMDGEVIGFGGRILPGAPEDRAKYINTPESPLYKKSRVLYGIDVAREHIRRTRAAVVVEGYFDVVGLREVGVKNAIAVCGTALTPEHVDLLRRLDCRTLTFLFDGDAAGVAAATKAATALLSSPIMGKVALLPSDGGSKTDPDEFARKNGAAATERLIEQSVSLTDYLIERAIADHCGPRPKASSYEQRVRAYEQLKPLLAAVPKGLPKKLFEEHVAQRVDLNIDSLREELGTARTMVARPGPRAAPVATRVPDLGGSSKAIDALGVLASFPSLAGAALDEHFLGLFVGLPLESVARDLVNGDLEGEQVLERLSPLLPASALSRVKKLLAEARPEPAAAEREFRKATIEAKIEQVAEEMDRLSAEIATCESPVPEELQTAMQLAWRRRSDLEKRRDGRRSG